MRGDEISNRSVGFGVSGAKARRAHSLIVIGTTGCEVEESGIEGAGEALSVAEMKASLSMSASIKLWFSVLISEWRRTNKK